MYVRKLGEYYGATAYALYPSQSTQEDSHHPDSPYYAKSLAKWLARGILSSRSLSKILTFAELSLSPRIRFGIGLRGQRSSLPARILDDLAVCTARAYYTAHYDRYGSRRVLDMEESDRRGESFVYEFLARLDEFSAQGGMRVLLSKREREIDLICVRFDLIEGRDICGRPDAITVLRTFESAVRGLIIEVADTASEQVLRDKHILGRMIFYSVAWHLYLGALFASLYISLSPRSNPPAILFKLTQKAVYKLERLLEKIADLIKQEDVPRPQREKTPCRHCVYAHYCKYRRD